MAKDILVNLSLDDSEDRASRFAISLATTLETHLSAVAYRYEMEVPGVIFDAGVIPDLLETQRVEAEQKAVAVCRRFEEAARRAGLATDLRAAEVTVAGAANHFGTMARIYDLSVVSQPTPAQPLPESMLIESALFESGRPVIVVPFIHANGVKLDHITVCWDGSRAAARAVADALPILKKGKKIELLVVENKERPNELPGVDMAEHLARYSLKVEVTRDFAVDLDVGNVILSHVADTGSNFLVMGGYGHSRLREFILGGVTKSLLEEMTIPTLMSH